MRRGAVLFTIDQRPFQAALAQAQARLARDRVLAENAARQAARYAELNPWPDVAGVLGGLTGRIRLGVVTNCSQALARVAIARTGIAFDAVVSAERAGWYKPRPESYRLALAELGVAPAETLFVAGSAYDLAGAAGVGMPVFWHDRIGMPASPEAPPPLLRAETLAPLRELVFGSAS